MKEKRDNVFAVRLTDSELGHLETLETQYAASGVPVSRSFLLRYGLKRLPLSPAGLSCL